MRIPKTTKLGMLVALAGIMLFSLGGVAFAADGPTPPKLGDPVGADISPHGGYSASSNYCLQCHEVHKAAGDYALLASATVTATCNTCHGLPVIGSASATGRRTPLEPANPGIPGTTSVRAAYTVITGRNAIHGIGSSSPPGESGITMTLSDWAFGWQFTPPTADATTNANTVTATGGGLYCASCHTPHGEFGRLANASRVLTSDATGEPSTMTTVNWAENTIIWWDDPGSTWKRVFLHQDANPAAWEVCDLNEGGVVGNNGVVQTVTPVGGAVDTVPVGVCAYAQVNDTDQQLVSLYGYKLLSMNPNHSYSTVKSWGTDKYTHDAAKWCGTCHPSRLDSAFGGTFHNHPTGCEACHGNPSGTAAGAGDFPHTSANSDFLVQYPDALCISCHTGGLP